MSVRTTTSSTVGRYNPQLSGSGKSTVSTNTGTTNSKTSANNGSSLKTALTQGTYVKQAVSGYISSNDKNKDGRLSRDEVTLSDEAYAKLDANSDGKVARSELQKALQGKDTQIYQYYKTGGAKTHPKDVVATLLSNAGNSTATSSVTKAATQFIKDHDRSKDGKLSRAETTLSAEEFAKLDANSDGKLARIELAKALDGKGAAIDQYAKTGGERTHEGDMVTEVLFTSNAGNITDFSSLAASRLLKAKDKNGDLGLSASEVSLSLKAFAKIDQDSDKKITQGELTTALASKNAAIQKYYRSGGTGSLADLTTSLLKTI